MRFKSYKLGDLISISKGRKAPEVLDAPTASAKRYIQINDLRTNEKIIYAVDPSGVEVTPSDISIAWDGANAGTVGYGLSGYIGSTIARLRSKSRDQYFSPYVGRFLQTKFDYLNGGTTGATIPHVSKDKLLDLEIPLPPLDEQRRIAAILDKADAIRRKRQESIRLTEEFLRSTFLEMFGDPVTNPKGWEVCKINRICTEIVDCVNRTAQTVDYVTPYKMIRTTNVRNYSIDLKDVRYVNKEVYDQWTRRLVPKCGDIVFTREAPAGEAGIIESDDKVFLGQRTMHFRPDTSQTTSEYLLFELMGSGISRQIEIMSSGSTVKHLSVPECKEFVVRVPPIALQKKFSALVNCIKAEKLKQNGALKYSEDLFSSSVHRAFRGEL